VPLPGGHVELRDTGPAENHHAVSMTSRLRSGTVVMSINEDRHHIEKEQP
jgi:hypothetical protein